MNLEQRARMMELQDKLFEVVMIDADPDSWSGAGLKPNELTQEERGDAYWCRKQAAASLGLFIRVDAALVTDKEAGRYIDPEREKQLDADINEAERQAKKLLDRVSVGIKQAAFERTNGKRTSA